MQACRRASAIGHGAREADFGAQRSLRHAGTACGLNRSGREASSTLFLYVVPASRASCSRSRRVGRGFTTRKLDSMGWRLALEASFHGGAKRRSIQRLRGVAFDRSIPSSSRRRRCVTVEQAPSAAQEHSPSSYKHAPCMPCTQYSAAWQV